MCPLWIWESINWILIYLMYEVCEDKEKDEGYVWEVLYRKKKDRRWKWDGRGLHKNWKRSLALCSRCQEWTWHERVGKAHAASVLCQRLFSSHKGNYLQRPGCRMYLFTHQCLHCTFNALQIHIFFIYCTT